LVKVGFPSRKAQTSGALLCANRRQPSKQSNSIYKCSGELGYGEFEAVELNKVEDAQQLSFIAEMF
jgi:hypothetical protein